MKRVIVYTDTLEIEKIAPAIQGYEILRTTSPAEAARSIVERSRVIALLIQCEAGDEEMRELLRSIKGSFPMLKICWISEDPIDRQKAERFPADLHITAADSHLTEQLKTFLSGIATIDRREYLRFDWPLRGSLSFDDRSWKSHNIWALSAEGAFLESKVSAPAQGERGTLRISFHNSRLTTACEVLDRRSPSSRLPAGFAVRFSRLNEQSIRLIDGIIQDALVQTLLEPESEPEIPSLDDGDLSIPGFESL